jgi:hypothetical protein
MAGSADNNTIDTRLQQLVERYLRQRSSDDSAIAIDAHPDDDTLSVFAEGNLSRREATPLVSHLAGCTFCRHKTAELVRLDLDFTDLEPTAAASTSAAPAKISEVLSGILSRLFGGNDAAVFAHEDKDTEDDEADDEPDEK